MTMTLWNSCPLAFIASRKRLITAEGTPCASGVLRGSDRAVKETLLGRMFCGNETAGNRKIPAAADPICWRNSLRASMAKGFNCLNLLHKYDTIYPRRYR